MSKNERLDRGEAAFAVRTEAEAVGRERLGARGGEEDLNPAHLDARPVVAHARRHANTEGATASDAPMPLAVGAPASELRTRRPGLASVSVRRLIGGGIALGGAAVLGSGLLWNPWTARLWMGARIVDKADVLASYLRWSLLLGALIVVLGAMIARGKPARVDDWALPALMIAALILTDRFILTRLGLTLWAGDPVLHFVHRPNVSRTLAVLGRPDAVQHINAHGFHDDPFPVEKPAGELRGLLLGDSVVMGYRATYPETIAAQLEVLLDAHDQRHAQHQVINAGVHGYSTSQERVTFERSLRFQPDFVVLGFCLNDVTEPFVIDEKLGGTGLDYHGVRQSGSALGAWVANDTGFGRLLQQLEARGASQQEAKRLEIYDVRAMAERSRDDPRFQEAWKPVLAELEKVYALAKEHDLPLLVVVLPFDFQLLDERTRVPQEILREHTARFGVEMVDLIPPLARAVYAATPADRQRVAALREAGASPDDIRRNFRSREERYFFDEDHFKADGAALVAREIYGFLERRGLADPAGLTTTTATTGGAPR